MLSFKAILGLALVGAALVGGGYASLINLRNVQGPRERRFVARVCAIGWLIVLSMLSLIYWFPPPYRYLIALGYFIVTPILVYRWALTHQMLRVLDARERDENA